MKLLSELDETYTEWFDVCDEILNLPIPEYTEPHEVSGEFEGK